MTHGNGHAFEAGSHELSILALQLPKAQMVLQRVDELHSGLTAERYRVQA